MLDDESDHTEKQSQEVESLSQNPLILLASEKIPSLIAQLDVAPDQKLESTLGYEVPILGSRRLQICQLLGDIVGLEIDELKEQLIPVYSSLFKLYLEFKENSFIQYIVESIFKQLFKPVKTDDYEKGIGLKTPFEYRIRVLKETQLLEKISIESVQNS